METHMGNKIENYLQDIAVQAGLVDNECSADLVSAAGAIGTAVEDFLSINQIASADRKGIFVTSESFGEEAAVSIDGSAILDLVDAAKVPAQHKKSAVEAVAILLHRNANQGNTRDAWASQNESMDNYDGAAHLELSDLLPENIVRQYTGIAPSEEAFGINSDQAITDMKMNVAVSLLKWHTSLTPRVLSVLGAAQPQVMYTINDVVVYDVDELDRAKDKRAVELYRDPSLVANELTSIVPLKANDTEDVLVADGVIKFGPTVNILKLAIDASKPGFGKIDRTDLVADSAKLDSVHFLLDDGDNTPEPFVIEVPEVRGLMSRISQGDVDERAANITHTTFLQKGSVNASGAVSDILNTLGDATDGLIIKLVVKPSIHLSTGEVVALASFSVEPGNVLSSVEPTQTTKDVAAKIKTDQDHLVGYELNAGYDEQNMRKSTVAVSGTRRTLPVAIPTGRNFIYDYALGDEAKNSAANIAILNSIIRTGIDKTTLDMSQSVLVSIAKAVAAWESDKSGKHPGAMYAAGSKIIPYVIQDTLDLTSVQSIRAADRFGDIKQTVMSFLVDVIGELHANTLFTQQLVAGAPVVYRCITNNEILANVLGVPHIHTLLQTDSYGPADGAELTVKLHDGTILECITTTFESWGDRIMIVPVIKGDAKSELNFGHQHDYGTMVAHYSHSGGDRATNTRIFANARETGVVSCPMGALIDVRGAKVASFRS